ncbi:hypothetical protein ACLBKU_16990 [Erythrobacter sp. NE805]|uniref:hypothetical protein n=1 Tax=Erythrobacter sp. NE805 TaxID=3389875 RepID=UPI00396AF7D0
MTIKTLDQDGGPIRPDTPLARALEGGAPPGLSAGFADRVVAAAEIRAAPLPELRRRPGRWPGWRTGRRLAFGLAGVVALGSAAAATGLFQQLALPLPAAETVWASLGASAKAAPAGGADVAVPAPAPTPAAAPGPVGIAGPIDTPEELGEAFRRVDTMRDKRRELRRAWIEQRIADELARRRAAGLPEPTPEQLAAVRARIEAAQARREQAVDAQVKQRREELQRRLEAGEALTRRDLLRPAIELPPGSEAFEALRRMPPRERREALRAMPPEQRAAILAEYRARREARLAPPPAPTPAVEPAPEGTPEQ